MIVPDNLTFAANTQATYNVIEASCKLGVRKVSLCPSDKLHFSYIKSVVDSP